MPRTKWFVHQGHALEIRYQRVMTSCQIWLYENDRPLGLHSTVCLREAAAGMAAGKDIIGRAMEIAVRDVEIGRFPLAPSVGMASAE